MGQDNEESPGAGQAGYFQLTRRQWLGAAGAGGVMLLVHQLADARPRGKAFPEVLPLPAQVPTQPAAAPAWSGAPGQARFRIEGLAKVSGQKIYARDFRAKDFPHWPQTERMALILRATQAQRRFTGLDLSALQGLATPLFVIVQTPIASLSLPQKDLAALKLTLPFSIKGPDGVQQLLVPVGSAPQFYGQPVAILVFENASACRRAKRALQFNPAVVQAGAALAPKEQPPEPPPYQPTTYLTRYEVPGLAPFSQVQSGYRSDPYVPDDLKPTNPSDYAPYNSTAKRLRGRIDATLQAPGLLKLGGRYRTQVLDPMFMEPEAGLAWLNAKSGVLNLVLGTQATNGDAGDSFTMFKGTAVTVNTVALYSCYPGGGFGGRDVSTFPPLLAVTAALTDGPVRIANDRFEQFQSGLKQLDSTIDQQIAVEPSSGEFVAFSSRQSLGAGGNNNYSQFVAALAGYCGLSGYNIKQAYVDAVAKPTLGVVAGSMRGFGGPQASWAVETLVDEVAVALKRDPIELRARNVLKPYERTITGGPIDEQSVAAALAEICRRARAQPLWQTRERVQRAKAKQGIWYGVGFALANQAYGTGTDGVMAEVALSPAGQLTVRSNCVDMGNGSATTLAISTAGWLGHNAARAVMGDVGSFNGLDMHGGGGGSWDDPRWTASVSMSSSACLTAFHQVHVTEQASRVLFETGLLPAAATLWGVPVSALQGKTRWHEGRLMAEGQRPLSLPELAAAAHRAHLPVGAMVHGLYQGTWVSASYSVHGAVSTWPIDGLALQRGGNPQWQRVERQAVIPPDPAAELYGRSLYAPSGALVAVEIDARTCVPRVVAVELTVDAGRVLQPDLLIGQAQGGIAMGIGYALLEDLPLLAEGAGDGRWNLDRYHVALASDVPLGAMRVDVLPSSSSTAKGIAEAVLCPIAPAIGNAVAHATGYRFRARSLPIRAAEIRDGVKS